MSGDSYLARVKQTQEELIDQLIEDDADLKTIKRKLWELLETKLKESWRNGKNSAGEMEAADKPRGGFKKKP